MGFIADEITFEHDLEPYKRFCRRCGCIGAAAIDGRVPRCGMSIPDGAFYVEPRAIATLSTAPSRHEVAIARARQDSRLLDGLNALPSAR